MPQSSSFVISVLVVLALTLSLLAPPPPYAEAAISCPTVASYLSPCVNYVFYGGSTPPATCCSGIKGLYNQAKSTTDRRAICSCIESVASSASQPVIDNAAALPEECGVNIPYKISPSTDCSKIQ